MNPRRFVRSTVPLLISGLMCASAHADGLFRAYLASDGLDTNPCTVVAPCRLLPAALAAVTDGGEIWMLDSANYNSAAVNITKSVTILAIPGAVGSVISVDGSAAAIVASTAGTSVALRNLRIVPFSAATSVAHGIQVAGAAKLTVEDSVISGHGSRGIAVSSATIVRISNCTIRDNGSSGVELAGGATAEISGSRFLTNAASGVAVFAAAAPEPETTATISDSVLSANNTALNVIAGGASGSARAAITRSTLSGSITIGVQAFATAGATALVTVGGNMIVGNAIGLFQGGAGTATLESLGDNIIRQNTTPSLGTITTVPLQ